MRSKPFISSRLRGFSHSLALALTLPGLLIWALAAAEPRPGGASEVIAPLPASLTALYPPAAEAPVHLLAMIGLQESFAGIAVDILDGDSKGAREGFAEFARRYREASELVPEWRQSYPEAPVSALAGTLEGGDPASAMRALDAVGAVCHSCHQQTMVPVQFRYRWGSIAALKLEDPLAGDEPSYAEFKRRLATNLAGIAHELRQEQVAGAARQYEAFRQRFQMLEDSCAACHDTPRGFYVGAEATSLIGELGEVVNSPSPHAGHAAELVAAIGRTSCSGCHLVHVPAAMAQAAYGATGGEFR